MMYLNPFMDQRSASSWERVWKGRGRYLSQVQDRGNLSTEGTPAAGQDEMRSRKISCVQTYG
jgi:hypothetical protein